MKKIINICFLWMCQLALFGQARIGDNPDYNPTSPSDPQMPDTTKYYNFSTSVTPTNGGSTNFSGMSRYSEGTSIYVRANNNTGYQLIHWLQEDSVVSTASSFDYIMPGKDVTLTAVFKYNPSNPADPDSLGLKYSLQVVSSPKQGGSFNVSSTEVQEGHSTNLYAYPNTGFRFKGWQLDGEIVSTASPYNYMMGDKDVTITGVFEYNPSNPSNPGKNSWNKATGEVIVDDFTAGSLYSAINQVTGGDNSSVTQITVSGKMSSNDFSIANNFSNCTMVDLKRTYGYTDVPDYAYDYNTALTSIILSASVENIGYRAFYQATNLTEVSCYAITPPTVESNAFNGIAEGAVLHVLSAAIPLYAEAEGWKDFTILPLTEEVQALEVNLPADSEDGRYKNMTLELVNAESGQKQKYVISDRVSYTFNGLLKKSTFNVYVKNNMDGVLGKIENIAIENEDVSVTFESLLQPQDITLRVQTPDGADVTSQMQIRWFDSADGYLQQGNKLSGLLAGTAVRYRITLPQALGMQYVLPTDSVYTIQEGGNALVCTLQPLEEVTISGRVKEVTTGSLLSGAVVSVSQKLNGLYSKAFTVKTDNKGEFTAKVFNDQSSITVSATDYLNQTLEFNNFNDTTFVGEVALKGITGATITTNLTYTTSVVEGGTAEVQNWYSDYANVAYEIYNETQQRAITQFNVQYPNIVLLEEVAEGDLLTLTASSRTNAFVPVKATASINAQNRAETTFNIVELGAVKAGFTFTDNASVVGILYDSKGQLMKKYTYSNASLSISNLADGNYTLVSMTNSSLFNSILNLSQFAASGLKEGTDYVQNTVTVKSGVVATISNDLIPVLDESKLYYTGDNTLFSVNKTSIVAGNYLTLKGKIDFKSAYSSKVSDISMVVDLPESCSFVENSVMVGSNISSYTLDGNRLTIPLTGKYTDQVRFCVIPTAGGDYAPSAFAQFTLDNKEVLQPIGNANFTVKDLTISVPSTVAKTTIPISGTALGNSTIEVYDNGVKIGETTSLANGVWNAMCELNESYNLSTHKIYAKVTTKQGLELLSETQELVYDMNAIQVNKVTMYYRGYVNEFDFQNPSSKPQSYTYSSNTAFTFTIDFNNNDTTKVSNVILHVKTMANTWVPLSTTFDKKKGLWVASTTSSELSSYPVNVSVDFNSNSEILGDAKQLQGIIVQSLSELEEDTILNDIVVSLQNFENDNENIFHELYSYLGIDYTEISEIPSDLSLFINGIISEDYSSDFQFADGTLSFVDEDGLLASLKSSYVSDFIFSQDVQVLFDEIKLTDGTSAFTRVTEEIADVFYENRLYSFGLNDMTTNSAVSIYRRSLVDEFFTKWNQAKNTLESLKNIPRAKQIIDNACNVLKSPLTKKQEQLDVCRKIKLAEARDQLTPDQLNQLDKDKLNRCLEKLPKEIKELKNVISRLKALVKFVDIASIIYDINIAIESRKEWNELINLIKMNECPGMDALAAKAENYRDWVARGYTTNISTNVACCVGLDKLLGSIVAATAGAKAGTILAAKISAIVCAVILDFQVIQGGVNQINDIRWKGEIQNRIPTIKCKCGDPGMPPCPDGDSGNENGDDDGDDGYNNNGGEHDSGSADMKPNIDPSGFVYEGVSSNRIEGVMASCYYKETVEDMYGDLHENVVLWDAEQYAQENPLFTDENGMYRWDVPQGLWQVKFEKEGYQTTYSEWLPVPPPQLEVNIAMTQNKQPEVKAARAYEDGIEVEFDKYMQLDGLTTENIFVTKNGETVAGTVTLLNEEQAYEDNQVKYASKLRFVPETSFLTTDDVTLTVSRKVKSYAGIQMENDYTQTFDIEKEVKSIVADSLIQVGYNREKNITVSALPYDAAIGKKMIVKNSSSMIASISADTLTLDENGQATFTLNGDLPGTAMLNFSLVDADVQTSSTVKVVSPELLMTASPGATRASGTAVYRGTEVGLTCETEGAVIYYTLDGSCPCDENAPRMVYENPITITEDMIIKAMAVGDDMYESTVSEFSFTIKTTNLGMDLKSGWNWVSHNMETEIPVTALPQDAARIVGQTAEQVNDPAYGLIGTLKTLQPDEAYKVQMEKDSIHMISGYEFNPATSIDLKSGWNWLGYPVSQVMSLTEAFVNLQPDNEDYIVGQDGFAQYSDGAWVGTLQTLTPGQGYIYHSQSEKAFAYNHAIVSKAKSLYARGLANATPWAVDKHKYRNVMPLIADLYVDGKEMGAGTYAVGAFCGTECRGIGQYVAGRLMMNIYGDGNETITFRAVCNETEETFDIVETTVFTETMLGSMSAPYALNVGGATAISEKEAAWKVWPAVTADNIYLSLDGETIDRVTLTDAYGNIALVKEHVTEGEAVHVASLADGVYIVTATQNGVMYYKKIVKVGK